MNKTLNPYVVNITGATYWVAAFDIHEAIGLALIWAIRSAGASIWADLVDDPPTAEMSTTEALARSNYHGDIGPVSMLEIYQTVNSPTCLATSEF